MKALETRGLSVGYDGVALLSGIDIEVAFGEIVTLVGPNGAGKSTMLKTLAGQLPPLAGEVLIAGEPLSKLSSHELALRVSVLLTQRLSTDLLTCADVVETGRYPHTGRLGVLSDADRAAVRDAMETVRVWDLRDRDFMQVSDGQRQRVLLARAICQHPRLLVLDEPSSYLDIRYQIELLEILSALAGTGQMGVIMSLHELSLARKVSSRIVCVAEGSVLAQGTPQEMFVPEVMDELYGLKPGSFDPVSGAIFLEGDR